MNTIYHPKELETLSLGLTMCQSHHARQYNGGMTTIKLEDAIGTRLARDITEIRPGEFKCPSTPMIPKAFAGLPIDMLAGSAITDPQQTPKIVGHGGGTRALKPFTRRVYPNVA